ncbi:hypothetical protein ACFPM0_32950 [Pseudonocardia sulfidoxydans]
MNVTARSPRTLNQPFRCHSAVMASRLLRVLACRAQPHGPPAPVRRH